MEIFGQLFQLLQKQILLDPVFFVLSSLIILSAMLVVIQNNLMRVGFTLIGCFSAIALLYFSLGAQFVAISQILIYAIGITLIVVFAIMLLAKASDESEEAKENNQIKKYTQKIISFASSFFAFILMSYSFIGLFSAISPASQYPMARMNNLIDYINTSRAQIPVLPNSLDMLGNILFSEQLLAFELISVLLLIAFVSAIVLSKKDNI